LGKARDALHDYEERLTAQEDIENVDIEQKRKHGVNYMMS
jgi:hypothetical protein